MDCLFKDVSGSCDGIETREHVIQENLGGTLESTRVICDACNHYFGDKLDPSIGAYYEPIVHILAPMMPGKHRKKQYQKFAVTGNVPLMKTAGGVVDLKKIRREYSPNGELHSLYAPSDQAHILEEIARREATGATFTITEVPVTDMLDEPRYRQSRAFNDCTVRAMVKTLLEVCDEYGHRHSAIKGLMRMPELRDVRAFVRKGKDWQHLMRVSPFYNLNDDMDKLFALATGFSIRVLVVYDAPEKTVFGVMQVLGAKPMGFPLAEFADLGPTSWSLLVNKDVLGSANDWSELENSAVVSWRRFELTGFSIASRDALEFAFVKVGQDFEEAMGRALVYLDNTRDSELLESLRAYEGVVGPAGAIEALLRLRYLDAKVPSAEWDRIASGLRARPFQAFQGASDRASAEQDVVHAYRALLGELVARYGMPRFTKTYETRLGEPPPACV